MSERNIGSDPRFTIFFFFHYGNILHDSRGLFCVPKETIRFYHNQMRDKHVQLLAPPMDDREGKMVRFLYSRLMCDVERLEGPEEIMEKYGMGMWYEKAYDGTVINRRHNHRPEYYRFCQA